MVCLCMCVRACVHVWHAWLRRGQLECEAGMSSAVTTESEQSHPVCPVGTCCLGHSAMHLQQSISVSFAAVGVLFPGLCSVTSSLVLLHQTHPLVTSQNILIIEFCKPMLRKVKLQYCWWQMDPLSAQPVFTCSQMSCTKPNAMLA